MPLPAELLDILVCPRSKQTLLYFPRGEMDQDEAEGFLLCPTSRLRYRIESGIAVMLIDEAEELSPDEVQRLVQRATEIALPTAGRAISRT